MRSRRCRSSSSIYNDPKRLPPVPDGPFMGDMADTIVNFTTETKIEDAQK